MTRSALFAHHAQERNGVVFAAMFQLVLLPIACLLVERPWHALLLVGLAAGAGVQLGAGGWDRRVPRHLARVLALIFWALTAWALLADLARVGPPIPATVLLAFAALNWQTLASRKWKAAVGMPAPPEAPQALSPEQVAAARRALAEGLDGASPQDTELLREAVHGRSGLALDGALTPPAVVEWLHAEPRLLAAWQRWTAGAHRWLRFRQRDADQLIDAERPGDILELPSLPDLVATQFVSELGHRLEPPEPAA